jgi:hypothetical protein
MKYKLNLDPKIIKKIKIFAIVGVVCILILGSLVIWTGVTVIKHVASSSPIGQLKTELNELPNLNALSCWDQAQGLISVRPWLERPALENLNTLKLACFPTTNP